MDESDIEITACNNLFRAALSLSDSKEAVVMPVMLRASMSRSAVRLCPLLLPLAMAGACAHAPAAQGFGELGADMPSAAPPALRSHSPFRRVKNWIGFTSPTPGASRRLGLDSPIASICARPNGRAVLDEDLPGLTTRPEYAFFKHMSLKTLKSMSRGQLTDEDLAKVETDLAKLEPPLDQVR